MSWRVLSTVTEQAPRIDSSAVSRPSVENATRGVPAPRMMRP
jgi:hypothetical protein